MPLPGLPTRSRVPPSRLGAVAVLAAALACLVPAPAAAERGADGLARALAAGELGEAEHALERARALFEPERARRLWGDVARPGPRDATHLLRDLAARTRELDATGRAQAERLLARPANGGDGIVRYGAPAKHTCDPRMCFWWVEKTRDAPRLADGNRNGVPDWVDRVKRVFGVVWAKEVGRFGYRTPRTDATARHPGPNGKLDIYVADIGRFGLYGYCTSDDRRRFTSRAVSAYCVVDDDFSRRQFPRGAAGLAALRVTAAHEFFHAVQFAYDWLEDLWLMEGTAAWIEDEVFDRVNDNRQYLRRSPLTHYWLPLDYAHPSPGHPDSALKYGAWIFFRHLSERHGRSVVRSIWRRADANRGAPNDYSIQAVRTAVERTGASFPDAFAGFGVANLHPGRAYVEGASYPKPTPTWTTTLTPSGVGRTRVFMDHLSNDYYRFLPGTIPPEATVTFTVELPEEASGPRASAVAEAADGALTAFPAVHVGGSEWTIAVPGAAAYSRTTLVLTNAGTRYTCWRGEPFSCEGIPLDARDFFFRVDVSAP